MIRAISLEIQKGRARENSNWLIASKFHNYLIYNILRATLIFQIVYKHVCFGCCYKFLSIFQILWLPVRISCFLFIFIFLDVCQIACLVFLSAFHNFVFTIYILFYFTNFLVSLRIQYPPAHKWNISVADGNLNKIIFTSIQNISLYSHNTSTIQTLPE